MRIPAISDLLDRSYRRDANAASVMYRLDLADIPGRRRREALDQAESTLMRTAASALPFSTPQRRRYLASATEQEIAHRGLLDAGREDEAAFCIFLKYRGCAPRPPRGRIRRFMRGRHTG